MHLDCGDLRLVNIILCREHNDLVSEKPAITDTRYVHCRLFLPCSLYRKNPEDGCYLQSMLHEIELMINYICGISYKTL